MPALEIMPQYESRDRIPQLKPSTFDFSLPTSPTNTPSHMSSTPTNTLGDTSPIKSPLSLRRFVGRIMVSPSSSSSRRRQRRRQDAAKLLQKHQEQQNDDDEVPRCKVDYILELPYTPDEKEDLTENISGHGSVTANGLES